MATTDTFEITNISVEQLPYATRGQRFNAVGTRGGRALITVDIQDETLLDNLIYRKSRPTRVYRQIINQVRESISAEHGINLDEFVWSQTAWCSCGCSPAFLVLSDRGYRISITVKGISNVADATAVNRAEQFGVKVGA